MRERLVIEAGGTVSLNDSDPSLFDVRLPRFAIAGAATDESTSYAVSSIAEPEADYERYREMFGDQPWRFVSMSGRPANTSHPLHDAENWMDGADIAARFYPVHMEAPGLRSIIVTIRQAYADALIPDSRAPSLLAPTRLQLRPDNVFYRSPNQYQYLRRGSRILFYVSDPEQALRGWGIVTSLHVGEPCGLLQQIRNPRRV